MENKLLVLVGFSGCGKDTIQRALEKSYGFSRCVSHTTRPMRLGEQQGREYFFINDKKIIEMEREELLLEGREYHTSVDGVPAIWKYALSKEEVSDFSTNRVTILDLQGAETMKEHLGEKMVAVFISVEEDVRKQRVMARGDFDAVEWERRAEDDRRVFQNLSESSCIDFIVPNFELEEAVCNIVNTIKHVDQMRDLPYLPKVETVQ